MYFSLQEYSSVVLASMHVRSRYRHPRNDVVVAAGNGQLRVGDVGLERGK